MLRLPHHWVWDSWAADDGELHHLFYLKAPRDEDLSSRHTRAVVGHATSPDLVTWTEQPDALGPRAGTAWDDLAIWTGSVVRDGDGRWRMFYTGISGRGGLKDQRLGQAVSDDLVTWERLADEPVAPVSPRWYKTGDDPSASETWRDPLVLRDPDGDGWHLLVAARAVGAAPNDDGVLAHARSRDLDSWSLQPPLTRPGAGFGQLEVAQIQEIDGRHVMVFTCHPDEQTPSRRTTWGDHCTWSVPGESLLGPWDIDAARPFTAMPDLFAAPLVQRRDGSWCLIGFRNRESEGVDAMAIIDPLPVVLDADGYLVPR